MAAGVRRHASRSHVHLGCHMSLQSAGLRPPALLLCLQADGIWRCYQNFAQWAGALYRRVANPDPSRHRDTPAGDVTQVDVGEVAQAVRELLPLVQQRRAERLGLQRQNGAQDGQEL